MSGLRLIDLSRRFTIRENLALIYHGLWAKIEYMRDPVHWNKHEIAYYMARGKAMSKVLNFR